MGVKKTKTNLRVEVYPSAPWHFGRWVDTRTPEQEEQLCQDIAKNIKRHVDNVEQARVIWDTEETCEFCGCQWGEESDNYNGGCCDKDEETAPKNKATPRAAMNEPI